jgi:hypothetical protein
MTFIFNKQSKIMNNKYSFPVIPTEVGIYNKFTGFLFSQEKQKGELIFPYFK